MDLELRSEVPIHSCKGGFGEGSKKPGGVCFIPRGCGHGKFQMDIQAYFRGLSAGDAACQHMWHEKTRQSEVSSQGILPVGPHLELRPSSLLAAGCVCWQLSGIPFCQGWRMKVPHCSCARLPLTCRGDMHSFGAPASFNLTRRRSEARS